MDIQLIDEFRRRTNASYDEARYYLERFNGDLLEAIIAFEQDHSYGQRRESSEPRTNGILNGFVRILQALLDIQLVVSEKNQIKIKLPIIILLLLLPLLHIIVIAGIIMFFMGFRFGFIREPNSNVNVDYIVNNIKDKFNENSKNR